MNDDDLLKTLGELARERERDMAQKPDLWSRLASGELSARELSDLEAQAASDPPLELSLRAYRPLSDDVRERIVDALSASLPKPGAPPADPPTSAGLPPSVSRVVSLDSRRRLLRAASPFAGVVMAIAALWVFVLRPPPEPSFAPLPAYDIVARGGLKETRGKDDVDTRKPLRLLPDSTLDLTLRPATKVEGPLTLRAFVMQNGSPQPWPMPLEIAPTGALRVHGPASELLAGLKGPVELRLVLGRAEALGEGDALKQKAASAEGHGPGWQTLRYEVELVEAH